VRKSLDYTFQFPQQETKRRADDDVVNVATLTRAGTITEIDDENLLVSIVLGVASGRLPKKLNIGPGGPINSGPLREAIYRFAADILAGKNTYPAVRDILSKASPRIRGREAGQAIIVGDDLLAATTPKALQAWPCRRTANGSIRQAMMTRSGCGTWKPVS
jgi:uncharacterized protein